MHVGFRISARAFETHEKVITSNIYIEKERGRYLILSFTPNGITPIISLPE